VLRLHIAQKASAGQMLHQFLVKNAERLLDSPLGLQFNIYRQ
jgi:hypothetical protein